MVLGVGARWLDGDVLALGLPGGHLCTHTHCKLRKLDGFLTSNFCGSSGAATARYEKLYSGIRNKSLRMVGGRGYVDLSWPPECPTKALE